MQYNNEDHIFGNNVATVFGITAHLIGPFLQISGKLRQDCSLNSDQDCELTRNISIIWKRQQFITECANKYDENGSSAHFRT